MNIPSCILFSVGGLLFSITSANALSANEIEKIARSTAVRIERRSGASKAIEIEGSGFISKKQGNTYTVVTNEHVIKCPRANCIYIIYTADRQSHQIPMTAVNDLKPRSGLDLAFLTFNSDRNYSPVKIGSSDQLKIKDKVYTSGFPYETKTFSFNVGEIKANSTKRLTGDRGGYSIIYNALTASGMSGSAVFNTQGQVVAIHGAGDKYIKGTFKESDGLVGLKVGFNRGIPIKWLSDLNLAKTIQFPTTADDFFILGFNSYVEPSAEDPVGSRRQALRYLNQAIALNSKYAVAYFSRGYVFLQLDEYQKALNDYDTYISIDPLYANAYNNRGMLKEKRVIADYRGALADYNQAIKLNPQNAVFYLNRGICKSDKFQDYVGALADYDQAIKIAPKFSPTYYSRGNLKYLSIGNLSDAILDYDQAILLDPDFAKAYHNRGLAKKDLKNIAGAKKDLQKAAELYQAQGSTDTDNYRKLMTVLQSLK
jgi:tetratricopeptide (TPR) repeat protein